MHKKLLSSLLIGAFVFGVGAANVQPVSAASLDKVKEAKEKYDKAKDTLDKAKGLFGQKQNGDNSNRPEPPKDENGNPLPPPDKQDGDDSNRPEPPKDENGNPLPPPDKKDGSQFGDVKDKLSDAKDKYDSAKDKYNTAKGLFKK